MWINLSLTTKKLNHVFEPHKKLLTIGITAYNEEKYIRQTIESCVHQAGFIIVCDNASTDSTPQICAELAQKYGNVIHLKMDQDLGKEYGYNYPLKQANTKYFMWLGGHDFLDENYTAPMILTLENTNAVGCYPASRWIEPSGNEIGIFDCWYANDLISNSATKRVYTLIENLHELSAIHGIYRTEIAQKYPIQSIIGSDHVFLSHMAYHGRMIFSPRSILNWRKTKINLSNAEILKMCEETSGIAKSQINYQQMCVEQLAILKKCKVKNPSDLIKKLNLIRKAQKKLRSRFGYKF